MTILKLKTLPFGHNPKVNIVGQNQFDNFPHEIGVVLNLVHGFQAFPDLDGNNKFLRELVFFNTANGRIFQIGLKLLELFIQGHLLESTNLSSSERQERVNAFEKEVYKWVIVKSASKFFSKDQTFS
jgi:hypothetical protein